MRLSTCTSYQQTGHLGGGYTYRTWPIVLGCNAMHHMYSPMTLAGDDSWVGAPIKTASQYTVPGRVVWARHKTRGGLLSNMSISAASHSMVTQYLYCCGTPAQSLLALHQMQGYGAKATSCSPFTCGCACCISC